MMSKIQISRIELRFLSTEDQIKGEGRLFFLRFSPQIIVFSCHRSGAFVNIKSRTKEINEEDSKIVRTP